MFNLQKKITWELAERDKLINLTATDKCTQQKESS